MRWLAVLIATLAMVGIADAQVKQYGQVTCTAVSTGGVPATVAVQRAPAGTTSWTTLTVLPMTGTPAASAPFIDVTRVAGTSYQYRCVESNAAGSSATDPSSAFAFFDVTNPDKGICTVVIISQ